VPTSNVQGVVKGGSLTVYLVVFALCGFLVHSYVLVPEIGCFHILRASANGLSIEPKNRYWDFMSSILR
jgi:hypothetical protein